MRHVEGYPLWLGHIGDARNLDALIEEGVVAVVDLALEEPPRPFTREMVYCRFPLIDGENNPPWLLRAAVETVAGLMRARIPTLVYCGAGLSRTPSVAGAALALVRRCPLAEGLAMAVEPGKADVSPALWSDLEAAIA